MAKSIPDPIDKHVGGRVRMRRNMFGLSQTELAEALGVTFQQIQKYEKGINRISASSLQKMSDVLDVPISFFFDETFGQVTARKEGQRTIKVSVDVFDAIWNDRLPGENTINDVLRRKLAIDNKIRLAAVATGEEKIGYYDRRFGVKFPEEFLIFKRHRGILFQAKATNNSWLLLNDGSTCKNLNRLNAAIGLGGNAWQQWSFIGEDGNVHRIKRLRIRGC